MVQARQNMLHFVIAQLMIHSFWAQENHNSLHLVMHVSDPP